MATKKYVSYNKLQNYDALIKQKMATDDDIVLTAAKDYADSLLTEDGAYTTISEEYIDILCGQTLNDATVAPDGNEVEY